MDWLAQILREIDPIWWGWLLMVVLSPACIHSAIRLRRNWLIRRLRRRLARDPYILQSELDERERQIGDPPPPVNWGDEMRAVLPIAAIFMLFALIQRLAEQAQLVAMIVLVVGASGWSLWKWYRQPADTRGKWPWSAPDVTIPREAAYGFLAAVVFVGILLVGFWQLI